MMSILLTLITIISIIKNAQSWVEPNSRIDCHPEPGLTKDACINRGCTYDEDVYVIFWDIQERQWISQGRKPSSQWQVPFLLPGKLEKFSPCCQDVFPIMKFLKKYSFFSTKMTSFKLKFFKNDYFGKNDIFGHLKNAICEQKSHFSPKKAIWPTPPPNTHIDE